MRLTIERIRTIVLVAAALLLAALGVLLARAKWKNLLSRHDLPGPLAKGIVQEANGYTFVHAFGARSQYKIHASKEIELKTYFVELHDVQIDLFGPDGSRIDHIAGDAFEFNQKTGVATAQGPVDMLMSRPAVAPKVAARDAGRAIAQLNRAAGSAGQIDVKTSGVSFDRNTGLVTTSELVNFTTAQGYGSAIGAKYDSQNGHLTLQQSVALTTHRGAEQVVIRAQHAEFDRGAQTCWMEQASAESRGSRADAVHAKILFRSDGSAERLDATGGFTLAASNGGHVAAPIAAMDFDEHNQPRHGHLEGGVRVDSAKEGRVMRGTAPTAELDFTAQGQLKNARLERNVEMHSDETSEEGAGQPELRVNRTWRSQVLDINFRQQKHASQGQVEPETMRGTGGVVVTSNSQSGNGAMTPSKMSADEVTGVFRPGSVLRSMTGVGHAGIEKTTGNGAQLSGSGDRLQAEFEQNREQGSKGSGGASEVQSAELESHVVLIEQPATKSGAEPQPPVRATAGKAVYEEKGGWLHLAMSPRVENGEVKLTADKVDVSQQSGDAFARGNVKASWSDNGANGGKTAAANSGVGQSGLTLGSKGPAHVVAAEAQLNQSTGEAIFRGHARFWQQANFVTAPAIALNQHLQTLTAKSMDAREPVRVVMLSASVPGQAKNSGQAKSGSGTAGEKSGLEPVIRVNGGDLWYSDAERRAVMRSGALGAVTAETGLATSLSDEAELRLMPAGNGGAQAVVDQMTAKGHVVLTFDVRRGTGEQAVYSSVTGEYVLTGTATTPPKISDPARGTVTGEALIFHSRDDSVSIEGGGRETITETTAPEAHGK